MLYLSWYTLWLFNSLPWKITMLSIGKPSISMDHLYHGKTVSHNQRVYIYIYICHLQNVDLYTFYVVSIMIYIYTKCWIYIYIYTCSDTPLQDIASLRHPSARKSGRLHWRWEISDLGMARGVFAVCVLLGTREKHGGTQPMARLMWSVNFLNICFDLIGFRGWRWWISMDCLNWIL